MRLLLPILLLHTTPLLQATEIEPPQQEEQSAPQAEIQEEQSQERSPTYLQKRKVIPYISIQMLHLYTLYIAAKGPDPIFIKNKKTPLFASHLLLLLLKYIHLYRCKAKRKTYLLSTILTLITPILQTIDYFETKTPIWLYESVKVLLEAYLLYPTEKEEEQKMEGEEKEEIAAQEQEEVVESHDDTRTNLLFFLTLAGSLYLSFKTTSFSEKDVPLIIKKLKEKDLPKDTRIEYSAQLISLSSKQSKKRKQKIKSTILKSYDSMEEKQGYRNALYKRLEKISRDKGIKRVVKEEEATKNHIETLVESILFQKEQFGSEGSGDEDESKEKEISGSEQSLTPGRSSGKKSDDESSEESIVPPLWFFPSR